MSDVVRCHLCRARDGLVYDERTDLWWCTDVVECNFRSRRRLGVPKELAEELREKERTQQKESNEAVT